MMKKITNANFLINILIILLFVAVLTATDPLSIITGDILIFLLIFNKDNKLKQIKKSKKRK